ncbi:odorant receptor 49b-like, partial [Spodoptera litura]|uniref:Odorant receptor n=1 Tax=Spodoptera litura TaxID=69820 RepID=A0A9J7ERY2_SPOLT
IPVFQSVQKFPKMSDKCSIGNVLKFLEDPEYPSVGPHLKLLGFTGLWHPNRQTLIGRFKQILFYVTITFFFSQYIKCFIKFNADSLKLILQYAPFHMGIVKSCFFQKDYKNWELVIDYMSSVERKQLAKNDKKHDDIIHEYIKRNRKVSYFFWALAFFSNFSIFTEPYQKNQINENGTSIYLKIFDGYTPFDNEPPGYYFSMLIQTVLGHIVSAYVVGWDTLVVSIMIFFTGQLKITCMYCRLAIDALNSTRSHENIAKCHRFYTTLVEYTHLFNALISPVMFMYLVVISINLGVCIVQIVEIHDDITTLVSSILFVIACLIQLLLFYWFANEVTVESTFVSYSTFESDWPQANKKLQKEVALLGLTTKKILVFRAGPFNQMSLTTFIAILRASYSFYTLLNSTN